MTYVIEGCSSATSPTIYTIQFGGNNIIYFNPRPIITIEYIAAHSYTIHMDANISFTTLNSGVSFHNMSEEYITVSCGTFNTGSLIICGNTILPNYDIVHVKFTTKVDNFNVNDYYQFKIGILPDGVTVQAYTRVFRTKNPLFSTTPMITDIHDVNNDDTDTSNNSDNSSDNVKIPKIYIEGQTNVDGTNLGDMKFTMIDKYSYYKCDFKTIIGTKCGKYTGKKHTLKTTIFRKYGKDITLENVLKGKGCNAIEKAKYMYKKDKKLRKRVGFYEFYYNNLTLYAMSKYILSYLLYHQFDIHFLLGKYNEAFFKNLANSRFCHFIDVYTGDLKGYNKYFKEC